MHVLAYVYGMTYYGGVLSLTLCSQGALRFGAALVTPSRLLLPHAPSVFRPGVWHMLGESDFWQTLVLQTMLRCRGGLVAAAAVRLDHLFLRDFLLKPVHCSRRACYHL
jgi:hypothetical protein